MAAGGWVRYNIWGEPTSVKRYWVKQAEYAYDLFVAYPKMDCWEQLMYWYLFKSVGYEE